MKYKLNLFIGVAHALLFLAPFLLSACQTSSTQQSEQGTMMKEGEIIAQESCSCKEADSQSAKEACSTDEKGKKITPSK